MPSTLSTKGQITIPKKIRDALDIRAGDVVDFIIENKEVKLKGKKQEQGKRLAGSLNKYFRDGFSDDEIREITKGMVAIDTAKEELEIPNKTTIQTFKDTDIGKNLIVCKNSEDFFNKLKI
jgi:AbrB family looped-hinge helix DNA binding protein